MVASDVELDANVFPGLGGAVAFFQVGFEAVDPGEEIFGISAGVVGFVFDFDVDGVGVGAVVGGEGVWGGVGDAADGDPAGGFDGDFVVEIGRGVGGNNLAVVD